MKFFPHIRYMIKNCILTCQRRVCVFWHNVPKANYACSLHAKSGLPTKSRHTLCLLLVLASDSDSSSLKTEELTIKLWRWSESALGIKIISQIILTMNESPLLVKTSHIPVRTSHAKCWPFKYWWPALSNKVCKQIEVRSWWRSFVCVCMRMHVCACAHVLYMQRVDFVLVLYMRRVDELPTKSRHTQGPLLVLALFLNLLSLKTLELTPILLG